MSIKGILGFFEEHIEKIFLILASIVCVWFLLTWVVISPNHVEFEGRKFLPGTIDNHIYNSSALSLKDKLNRQPEPASAYEPEYDKFVTWLNSPLSNINPKISPPLPGDFKERITEDRVYNVPPIGEVVEAVAGHIRTVAYTPTQEITPENPYDKAKHEPNDIDLVTVEAKFDTAKLYESFYENYAGSDIQVEWQDPCNAKPIFAAVDLQRQESLPDGSWSNWKNIPRAKIDSNKELFKIIENAKELPGGGIELRLLQYEPIQITQSLLQPNSYEIASSKEEWFPPALHTKYNKIREDAEREERRTAAELAEKEKSDKPKRSGTAGGGMRGGTSTRGGGGAQGSLSAMFSQGGTGTRGAPTRGANVRGGGRDTRGGRTQSTVRPGTDTTSTIIDTAKPKQTATKDIEDEFNKLLVKNYAKIYKRSEPLTFWALDDTVKPNRTYRYRIRLGVFNPMAGTKRFTDEYKSYQDKVILWSKFSNETDSLDIPSRLYFFPLSVQEDTKSVEIKVSKYVLGYWHSNRFQGVKPGEQIGKVTKTKPLTEEEKQKNIKTPKEIDFNTGAILMDVVPVNEWVGTSNLSRQAYNDLLYSFGGEDILRIPVKSRYWTQNLLNKFNEINRLEKEPRDIWREFGAKSRIQRILPGKGKGGRGTMEDILRSVFEKKAAR
ncbi:MAG: hypothetical protein ACYSTX_00355 [Planctomycetota bacterium]|jgi:hypothetical protein